MRSLALRHFVVWLGLDSMDKVGEFDGFLDEEDGNIVADDIPIALIGVELCGEASNISHCVCTASTALHGGKADEGGGGTGGVGQDFGGGDIFQALEELEVTMGTGTSSVDDSLWNTLMVEAVNLGKGQGCRARSSELEYIPSL